MEQRNYRLTFDGITPLVMNNNAGLIEGVDKGRDKAQYEREHFMDLVYRRGDGLIIPARAIKKALSCGCKFVPEKPKGVRISYATLIEAALLVDDDAVLDVSIDKVQPWTVIVNLDPSKGPKGPRGPRTRPLIPIPWHATTGITVMDDLLGFTILVKIAEMAGLRCGLLDARAIDMGRCHITVTAA